MYRIIQRLAFALGALFIILLPMVQSLPVDAASVPQVKILRMSSSASGVRTPFNCARTGACPTTNSAAQHSCSSYQAQESMFNIPDDLAPNNAVPKLWELPFSYPLNTYVGGLLSVGGDAESSFYNGVAGMFFSLDRIAAHFTINMLNIGFEPNIFSSASLMNSISSAITNLDKAVFLPNLDFILIVAVGIYLLYIVFVKRMYNEGYLTVVKTLAIAGFAFWFLAAPATHIEKFSGAVNGISGFLLEATSAQGEHNLNQIMQSYSNSKGNYSPVSLSSQVINIDNRIWTNEVIIPWSIMEFGTVDSSSVSNLSNYTDVSPVGGVTGNTYSNSQSGDGKFAQYTTDSNSYYTNVGQPVSPGQSLVYWVLSTCHAQEINTLVNQIASQGVTNGNNVVQDTTHSNVIVQGGNIQPQALALSYASNRIPIAIMILINSVVELFVVGMMGLLLIVAQIILLVMVAVSPFILLISLIPGRGHRLFKDWMFTALGTVGIKIIFAVALSILILVQNAFLKAMIGNGDVNASSIMTISIIESILSVIMAYLMLRELKKGRFGHVHNLGAAAAGKILSTSGSMKRGVSTVANMGHSVATQRNDRKSQALLEKYNEEHPDSNLGGKKGSAGAGGPGGKGQSPNGGPAGSAESAYNYDRPVVGVDADGKAYEETKPDENGSLVHAEFGKDGSIAGHKITEEELNQDRDNIDRYQQDNMEEIDRNTNQIAMEKDQRLNAADSKYKQTFDDVGMGLLTDAGIMQAASLSNNPTQRAEQLRKQRDTFRGIMDDDSMSYDDRADKVHSLLSNDEYRHAFQSHVNVDSMRDSVGGTINKVKASKADIMAQADAQSKVWEEKRSKVEQTVGVSNMAYTAKKAAYDDHQDKRDKFMKEVNRHLEGSRVMKGGKSGGAVNLDDPMYLARKTNGINNSFAAMGRHVDSRKTKRAIEAMSQFDNGDFDKAKASLKKANQSAKMSGALKQFEMGNAMVNQAARSVKAGKNTSHERAAKSVDDMFKF